MASSRSGQTVYAGFDLGTTNSAAAVFDGDSITVVRSSAGSSLTPSVVRIDGRGHVSVGDRARRFLDRDPDNTHAEFKRLMGTGKKLRFEAARVDKRPLELAADVLSALRKDVEHQLGFAPEQAVISVPALFEVPQNTATSEAAQRAGFDKVELLQEPIASALAAGWTQDDADESWLVYDLGGGTFDASLLESRDGLLRVVGHDGDNFLGGRDFDRAIATWAIEQLAEAGIKIDPANPDHASAVRALRRAAEEAKIELSRADSAPLVLPELRVGDRRVEVDLSVGREVVERTCRPIVDKSIAVCSRLLAAHGLAADGLARIVLVGGPTVTPFLRDRLREGLSAELALGHDPMTLVAQGAALYAATAGLPATVRANQSTAGAHKLWLQYPAVSADLTPHVVGRLLPGGDGPPPATLELRRGEEWRSPAIEISDDGGFVAMADLIARKPNHFTIEGKSDAGEPVPVHPSELTIVQGLTITDPPLSRTIGVALANNQVQVYFERGVPLPARRTFVHHTIEGVAAGSDQSVLKIPLVQGEFEHAHLCRLVGTLEITGEELRDSLPVDTEVEVTLELDRGGRLTAHALVASLDQTFDRVAQLLVPEADSKSLEENLDSLVTRISKLRSEAFRNGWTRAVDKLTKADAELATATTDLQALRGGDADAGQKARRSLLDVDAMLVELELERKWPELEREAQSDIAWATTWVGDHGTDAEKRLLDQVSRAIEEARVSRNLRELQRQLRLARRLGTAALYRDPEAWERMFAHAASQIDAASDLPRARRLVAEGRALVGTGDRKAMRRVVEALWRLLPADSKLRRLSFDSGIR